LTPSICKFEKFRSIFTPVINYNAMKIRVALILALNLIVFTALPGQNSNKKIIINGLVVDQDKNPVANALIFIDGEKTNQTTDNNGSYKIKIKAGSTKIGVLTKMNGLKEETINGRTTINFTLGGSSDYQSGNKNNSDDEEQVNVGYGSVDKKDLTQQVNKIDTKNTRFASYTNIYDLIRGVFPSVRVIGTTINIEGSMSLYASTEPLFIVDGVTVESIGEIPPQMISSIEILKGAAATIYGTRGSNGVILITLISSKDNK
jgi:TonB-dependent SusC/RagA subfamily outer membrane receptor